MEEKEKEKEKDSYIEWSTNKESLTKEKEKDKEKLIKPFVSPILRKEIKDKPRIHKKQPKSSSLSIWTLI